MRQWNKTLYIVVFIANSFFWSQSSFSHCQIPCGIYDDNARIKALLEDSKTIEKSVNQIIKLTDDMASKNEGANASSHAQLIRWVLNKDAHAQKIILSIADYFLTQRVKPSHPNYLEQLASHHAVIVAAMRNKQNVDISIAATLTESIKKIENYYPEHTH